MSDGPISIRLAKAAAEFNVGVDRIIDLLNKKGQKIDSNPNTKLSPEMYAILVKEFQPDKAAKDIAKHIELEYNSSRSQKAEEKKVIPAESPDTEAKELLVRSKIQEIAEKPSTDVVDKVLEVIPEPKAEPKPKPVVEQKPIEAPVAEIVETVVEVVVEKTPVEIIETKESEKPKAEKEVKEVQEVIEAKSLEVEIPVVNVDPETVSVPSAEIKETTDSEEHTGPKVIGSIDLSVFDRKPKAKIKKEKSKKESAKKEAVVTPEPSIPVKAAEVIEIVTPVELKVTPESRTENNLPPVVEKPVEVIIEEEKKAQEVAPKATDQPSADGLYNKSDSNYLKTRFTKLEGPKIVSKIELPQPSRPDSRKPVASSDDDNKSKKRKRKRLNKGKTGAEETAKPATPGTPATPGAKPHEKPKPKPQQHKDRARFAEPKPELSEEDIQKQIKETLQRLSGTGKSKASKYRREKRHMISQQMQDDIAKQEEDKKILKVTEFVTANDLSVMMNVPVTSIIATCMAIGMFVSINQRLDAETITVVADEFGFKVEFVSVEVQEAIDNDEEADDPTQLKPRNPIVTVMGHVDHGKTSLLDHIRSANVIAGEAGGITQHIGAYEVKLDDGRRITFLDTPGHEAFTAMRARGAQVTDIVIVVIAADDTVMPQTKEAINHAQAAGVPMVFAINKIDRPGANPEKIKEELSKLNILVEDWGGKYQSQEISAKKGQNVELLLDKVLLEAELLDLHANPSARASGTVIESSLDKGRGYVAKLLVQNGTLKIGDFILAGSVYGKVKAMYNERNLPIKEAGPSVPVLLLGLTGAPQAGDKFKIMVDEREAKQIATKRQQLQREQGIRTQKHITLDEIGRRIAIGDFKELNIIVKGDVDGSVEALSDSLLKLANQQVQVNVIHKSVGAITESDVLLASASNAIIVGFQVRPSMSARKIAEREEIDIRLYSIIYTAINEIKLAIEGMLAPEIEEKIVCNVEIREVFKIVKVGSIAGCMVLDGKITRNTRIRIIRDGIVVHTGSLGSLKRFKDDVREVLTGYECGLNIDNFNDIKIGDIVEGYEEVEVKRKL